MITKNKDRINIILSCELEYLEEKILYIYFNNNQVTYLIDNPYYQDVQIGNEYVFLLLKSKPKLVNEYVYLVCNEYGSSSIEGAIRALYALNSQGIIKMNFVEVENKESGINFRGYFVIEGKENNILEVQKECLLMELNEKKNRCCVKNCENLDIFDVQFMRKGIFSFRYDYFIFYKNNKKNVIVVENRDDGCAVVRYLNIHKLEFRKLLKVFVAAEFHFNEFCNQIRIELSDSYLYENRIIGEKKYFRKYMEMRVGKLEHTIYGYQVLRRDFLNDR